MTASPPTPPQLLAAAFDDVDDQAAALAGWNQSYLQVSAGAFHGEVRQLRFAGVRIFVEDLRQAVHQTGWLDDGAVALGLPLSASAPATFCGQTSDADSLHVFSGEGGFEFRSPMAHVMLGLEIDESLFAELRRDADGADFGRHAHIHATDAAALNGLRDYLLAVLDSGTEHAALFGEAPVLAGVVDGLLDKLAPVVGGTTSPAGTRPATAASSASTRRNLVLRAHDLMQAQLRVPDAQAPTVASLCAAVGVSRRSLQYCFHDVWGVSPLAHLRMLRLNAARRELKTAASVTEAATRLGFWHFGHFAHDFRAMFGELPSQTFRRHHGWLGSSPPSNLS